MHLALKSAMSRIPYTNKVGETLSSIADPVAAYSLRALGGGDPMVARVRRSSDDAEKNFTASDVGSGSVADWVNEDVVTTLNAEDNSTSGWVSTDAGGSTSVVSIESSSPITGSYSYKFANTTTGTNISYPRFSKRSLPFNFTAGNTYNIKCKLKLISGSATLKEGRLGVSGGTGNLFISSTTLTTNNVLEVDNTITPSVIAGTSNAIEFLFDGTLGAFEVLCDDIEITQLTANGYVTTLYNQLGNSNDATQSTAASQPKIVDAGMLLSDGIKFDGIDDLLGFTEIALSSSYAIFGVFDDSALPSDFIASSTVTANRYINLEADGDLYWETDTNNDGIVDGNIGTPASGTNLLSCLLDSLGTGTAFLNGTSGASASFADTNLTVNQIGGRGTTVFNEAKFMEIIIYNSDQSANRAAIETNINNYYDIY